MCRYDDEMNSWDVDPDCDKCDKKALKIKEARGALKDVLNQLYGKVDFDILKLENALDELCWNLDLDMYQGDLNVKPVYTKSDFLNYAKNIVTDIAVNQ